MLLAANTLPHDDPAKLERVYDTAGPAFFDRLLLPLRQDQAIFCSLYWDSILTQEAITFILFRKILFRSCLATLNCEIFNT